MNISKGAVFCNCLQCGVEFKSTGSAVKRGRGKYCSVNCLKKARGIGERVECTCHNCGVIFYVHPYRIKDGAGKHCSTECAAVSKTKKIGFDCDYCGEASTKTPSTFNQDGNNYCSDRCARLARRNRIQKTCGNCGKTFDTIPAYIRKGGGVYCSKECYQSNSLKTVVVKCGECGKEIKRSRGHAERNNGKHYCSRECFYRARVSQTDRTCINCGAVFTVPPHRLRPGQAIYCSKHCFDSHYVGERRPNWQGGISFEPYCPKFNNVFKDRVREFFGRKCILCGKTNEENGQRLSVHHVHHNKEACCDNTLAYFVPLCTNCHGRVHGKGEMFQAYFENLINNKYGGECYYTKEEYKELILNP